MASEVNKVLRSVVSAAVRHNKHLWWELKREIWEDGYRAPIDKIVNESPKMGWLVDRLKALAADGAGNHKVAHSTDGGQ